MESSLVGSNPGHQINLLNSDFGGYKAELVDGKMHNIENYIAALNVLNKMNVIDDLQYARYEKNIAGDYITEFDYDVFDSIVLDTSVDANGVRLIGGDSQSKTEIQNLLNAATWVPGTIGTVANFFDPYREFFSAEKYTPNSLVIGSNQNDTLVGDDSVLGGVGFITTIEGGNDLFYIGKGNDIVYGDNRETLTNNAVLVTPGIDVVAYNFSDTLIASEDFNNGSVSYDLYPTTDIAKYEINIDGTTDTLWDVEGLHFIDKASDETNLLAGASSNDTINGLGGNDYLYGADGNDIITGGLGNDRIHGGDGTDTAVFLGSYQDYSFEVKNFALEVKNNTTGEIDTLYSVENITIGSDTASTADVVWRGQNAFVNAEGLYESIDAKLLNMYAPIWEYVGSDADNLSVYGRAIMDNTTHQYTALQYELRETDDYLNPDDHWYIQISLGDDYLPETVESLFDLANTPNAQVRNVFDQELSHDNNATRIFLDVNDDEAYIIDQSFYITGDPINMSNTSTFNPHTLDIDTNHFDDGFNNVGTSGFMYHILKQSQNYDIDYRNSSVFGAAPSDNISLKGLTEGDMAMGFLFDNTNLANLGHFDLVGNWSSLDSITTIPSGISFGEGVESGLSDNGTYFVELDNYGNLVNPEKVDTNGDGVKDTYYFSWDINDDYEADGASTDYLYGIFNHDRNGATGEIGGEYRYAQLGGVTLSLSDQILGYGLGHSVDEVKLAVI